MPSLNSIITTESTKRDLASLLAKARPFLREETDAVPSDPALSSLLSTLRAAGAGECWHKHGTFLAHLTGVHRILTLWGAPLSIARCGLYHSAYSNSYVNLAIFEPNDTNRETLSHKLTPSAERLVHLFCIVPRHEIIHDFLPFHYTDEELADHLTASTDPSRHGINEPWRQKINSLIPPKGISAKHIRTGEDILVSRRIIAAFLLITMADFSDQLFNFQDRLFNNENGRLEFTGNKVSEALWPGDGRPGLWMNNISRMGAIYSLIVKEEEICKRREGRKEEEEEEEIDLVIPPVFENCTRVLPAGDQIIARELYWDALGAGGAGDEGKKTEKMLKESCEKNPFVGEPHVVLAQVYMGMGKWEEAEKEAERGLKLILEWGSAWDKRVTWEGWVAWARVLILKAKEKDWPRNPWGVLNLGLVK